MIVVDNVIRRGAVVDANSGDSAVQGVRRFNELLAREKRVSATEIQTVGSKGYDGFAFVLVGQVTPDCSGDDRIPDTALEKQTRACDSLVSQEGYTCVTIISVLPRDGS